MRDRLFHALRQQLEYDISFVSNVSQVYHDDPNNLDIVDFSYKGSPYRLILNGDIKLDTKEEKIQISSFHDLLQGLINSRKH